MGHTVAKPNTEFNFVSQLLKFLCCQRRSGIAPYCLRVLTAHCTLFSPSLKFITGQDLPLSTPPLATLILACCLCDKSMVQLPTSAVNVMLLAFAAERRAAAPLLLGAGGAAIDRTRLQ